MRKFLSFILVLCVSAGVPAFAQTKVKNTKTAPAIIAAASASRFGNTDGITAQQMKNYLEFIASDELEGRDTPSRGLDIAAMYIADRLKSWGIKPAGDGGGYFQKFPLKRNKVDALNTQLRLNGQSFVYGEDFLTGFSSATVTDSNVVYTGHGWLIKSKNIDAYQGIDVKDKVVVVASGGLPKGLGFSDLQGKQSVDWASPVLYAQMKGAKAIIYVGGFNTLANWQTSLWTQTEKGSLQFGKKSQLEITIPTIVASPRLVSALFQGEKSNGGTIYAKTAAGDAAEPFDLQTNKKISLNVAVKSENIYTQNVVGVLEGGDPVLKNEYVAVGAHYDHDGMNPFASGDDKIWNGADDDGSGTVAVMAIAEALAKGAQRPKRSILFVWHAAEEKGLWGSEYFADNPTVPIGSIITQLNIDMIGRAQKPGDENHPVNKNMAKPGEVYVVGSKMMSSELGELSESVNNSYLKLSFNYKFDDPNDPEQIFYRSDHYNYAKKGIPIIFYTDGNHTDYHQPSDSVEKIDFAQMERVTRTIFATGWELANRPTRPKVDKPLKLDGN